MSEIDNRTNVRPIVDDIGKKIGCLDMDDFNQVQAYDLKKLGKRPLANKVWAS